MLSTSLLLLSAAATSALVPSSRFVGRSRVVAPLRAAGGPPQYDKFDGALVANDIVGRGANLLRVSRSFFGPISFATIAARLVVQSQNVAAANRPAHPSPSPLITPTARCPCDTKLEAANTYAPGHVIALEIEDVAAPSGEWLRGPYTVTRATSETFDIIVKVVGKKSEAFAAAPLGTTLRFGGRFHTPILDGVDPSAERVVAIATGTGAGPVLGFTELAMAKRSGLRVDVFAGFRDDADVMCAAAIDDLKARHPDRLTWTDVVSAGDPDGRVSGTAALRAVAAAAAAETTHYHLIGNGAMVNEWRAGLKDAGVDDDRVTTEIYFNHKAEPDADVVARIASALKPAGVGA